MAAHRYWRIFVSAVNGATQTEICEVELRLAAGGADQCSGGTPTASGAVIGFGATNGFDNSPAASWKTNGTNNVWLKYDFGAGNEKDIAEVAIVAATEGPTAAPKNFVIAYSDDDSTFTPLVTLTNVTGWTRGQMRLFNSSGETAYVVPDACRYWRLVVSATDGGGSARVAEIELREVHGSADQTGSGTALTGTAVLSGQVPANAFDNNESTAWASDNAPAWLAYDFGSGVAVTVGEIALTSSANTGSSAPKDFEIQRSENWIGWAATSIAWTGITGWSLGQKRYFDATGETTGAPDPEPRRVVFVCM